MQNFQSFWKFPKSTPILQKSEVLELGGRFKDGPSEKRARNKQKQTEKTCPIPIKRASTRSWPPIRFSPGRHPVKSMRNRSSSRKQRKTTTNISSCLSMALSLATRHSRKLLGMCTVGLFLSYYARAWVCVYTHYKYGVCWLHTYSDWVCIMHFAFGFPYTFCLLQFQMIANIIFKKWIEYIIWFTCYPIYIFTASSVLKMSCLSSTCSSWCLLFPSTL